MKSVLTILSLSFAAQAVDLPPELNREMKKFVPRAKILTTTPCRLGEIESYGFLTDGGKGKNPLRPVIFFRKDKGKWRFYDVPTKVSNSKGSTDIVSEFWGKDALKKYQVRCTTPATDVDINTQANGEYSKEFEKIDASTLHLCYQASTTYNNWACFTYDKEADFLRASFVQINAD